MNGFVAALWAESLKARRSKIVPLTALGILALPGAGGLFMLVLKDPGRARALGLISSKAQLTAGTADWQSLFAMLSQGIAIGGAILFALITAWVFGREFSDRTAKDLMALPTARWVIVIAKLLLIALWCSALSLLAFAVGVAVGVAVDVPGWSSALQWASFGTVMQITLLTISLMPFVALVASAGRGYLPPVGWTVGALAAANILSVLGWGDWFPWAVPLLVSGMAQTGVESMGAHSYLVVLAALVAGVAATVSWWRAADQTR